MADTQACRLLDPGAGVVEEQQQCMVTQRERSARRQRPEQSLDLVALQESGAWGRHPLRRHGGQALRLFDELRHARGDVFEQATKSRQTLIAGDLSDGLRLPPWDLKHECGTRLEVKQSTARHAWHRCEDFRAKPPSFDIAPRTGYFTRDSKWVEKPGRHADIYVFAWHPETKRRLCDHRLPEQWTFYVTRTACLPTQRRIGLTRLGKCATQTGAKSLAATVEQVLARQS